MVGIHLDRPLPLCPNGFPPEIMDEFHRRIGRGSLGNYAASGTEIIKELGEEHMRQESRSSIRRPIACFKSPRTKRSFRFPSCTACAKSRVKF